MKIRFNNLKLQKVINPLAVIPRFAAEHLFLVSLVLIFISSLLGLAAFYKYYVLLQKVEPELRIEPVKFQEAAYQKIVEEWQNRGEEFDQALTKEYPDILK